MGLVSYLLLLCAPLCQVQGAEPSLPDIRGIHSLYIREQCFLDMTNLAPVVILRSLSRTGAEEPLRDNIPDSARWHSLTWGDTVVVEENAMSQEGSSAQFLATPSLTSNIKIENTAPPKFRNTALGAPHHQVLLKGMQAVLPVSPPRHHHFPKQAEPVRVLVS